MHARATTVSHTKKKPKPAPKYLIWNAEGALFFCSGSSVPMARASESVPVFKLYYGNSDLNNLKSWTRTQARGVARGA